MVFKWCRFTCFLDMMCGPGRGLVFCMPCLLRKGFVFGMGSKCVSPVNSARPQAHSPPASLAMKPMGAWPRPSPQADISKWGRRRQPPQGPRGNPQDDHPLARDAQRTWLDKPF